MKKEAKLRVGKVCIKHPELKGARYWANYRCTGCHKEFVLAKSQREYHNDPIKREIVKARARVRRQEYKTEVIGAYGGECELCGICDLDVLSIDHIGGGGCEHRRSVGNKGSDDKWKTGPNAIYFWLRKHNFPSGFRVLCFNCNIKDHIVRLRKNRGEVA